MQENNNNKKTKYSENKAGFVKQIGKVTEAMQKDVEATAALVAALEQINQDKNKISN